MSTVSGAGTGNAPALPSHPTHTPLSPKNPFLPVTPAASTDFQGVSGYLLCMVISLSMIAYLFLYIAPSCAGLAVTSGGIASCRMEPGAYVFGAAFVAIVLYAGYHMSRILFPARFS